MMFASEWVSIDEGGGVALNYLKLRSVSFAVQHSIMFIGKPISLTDVFRHQLNQLAVLLKRLLCTL